MMKASCREFLSNIIHVNNSPGGLSLVKNINTPIENPELRLHFFVDFVVI